MNETEFEKIVSEIPELGDLNFNTLDELIEILTKNNRVLWPTLKLLIGEQIRKYFETKNLEFDLNDNIYKSEFFGYYPTSSPEWKMRDSLELTFPNRSLSKTSISIIVTSTLIWGVFLVLFIFSNPEILLFGYEMISMNFLPLLGLPYVVLRLALTKIIAKEKFKRIETFNDLTEDMYGLNLWRYKENNFERLRTELQEFAQKPQNI